MRVEIWSDIVCPFCYIGKRRYEEALAQLPYRDEVETVYRSFELDPNAPVKADRDLHDSLAAKFGISREQAKDMNDQVTEQARSVGLTYNLDQAVPTNTFDAHRLTHLAAKHGKMVEMTERLFQAYFTEGKHIGDRQVLAELAADIGLDPAVVSEALDSSSYTDEVRADEREAAQLGIRGVPFFVINRKYAVSGAQPTEVFIRALEKARSEEQPVITVLSDDGDADAACTDGACKPAAKP
jgi:predicted DsbA family dithiol-disulfide isomerase